MAVQRRTKRIDDMPCGCYNSEGRTRADAQRSTAHLDARLRIAYPPSPVWLRREQAWARLFQASFERRVLKIPADPTSLNP